MWKCGHRLNTWMRVNMEQTLTKKKVNGNVKLGVNRSMSRPWKMSNKKSFSQRKSQKIIEQKKIIKIYHFEWVIENAMSIGKCSVTILASEPLAS